MHWREIFDYFPYCLNCRSLEFPEFFLTELKEELKIVNSNGR